MPFRIILPQITFLAFGLRFIFAQVDVIGDQNFLFIQNNNEINLPFFSNQSLDTPSDIVQKAVVVIHGANRNADDYYNSIYNNASDLDVLSETIIIAPQFLITSDLNHWQPSTEFAFWSGTTSWSSGGLSNLNNEHPRDYEISSYTIMDSLIAHLLTIYPNLQDIAIVGNSAGGQFVNRYAAGSDQEAEGKIRYTVSAPSSYLYMDEYRYSEYLFPINWGLPENCVGYNDYKYGLDDLNHYMSMMGIDSIRNRYSRRKIQYLIGTIDTGGTQDCESMKQGSNRLERAIIYYNYLQYFFGSHIVDNQQIALISGIGHDYNGIFSSVCGRDAIFDLGECEQYNNVIYPTADFSSNNNDGDYPHTVNFINESVAGTHPLLFYSWNINDSLISSDENFSYTFSYPGLFDVSLVAFDQIGFSDTSIYESLVQIDTLYGDIDWDFEVTGNDASLVLGHITGDELLSPLQQETGDASNNTSLSAFDASLILQFISGNIDGIPIDNSDSFIANGDLHSPEILGEVGEIITIPISIENSNNLYSFTISFEYSNIQLESGSVYFDEIFDYGFSVESVVSDSGSIIITGASPISLDGDMDLFTLYFIPTEFENGQLEIVCNQIMLNEVMQTQSFSILINNQLQIENEVTPNRISLENNFPNPFNDNTSIRFYGDLNKNTYLYINDIKGNLVKVLVDNKKVVGKKTIYWGGENDLGIKVQSGIYFYTLEIDGFKTTKKMLLLK